MQSRENLTRMSVILAFIAVRLLQLRFIKEEPAVQGESCQGLLGTKSWKLLWLTMEKRAQPNEAPDMAWAYKSLAILGAGRTPSARGEPR